MTKVKLISNKNGKSYEFNSFPIMIGRAPECNLLLGGGGISKRHATIELINGLYQIKDLKSLNGISVNGRSVTSTTLKDGDNIQFGPIQLTFKIVQRGGKQATLDASTDNKPTTAMMVDQLLHHEITYEPPTPTVSGISKTSEQNKAEQSDTQSPDIQSSEEEADQPKRKTVVKSLLDHSHTIDKADSVTEDNHIQIEGKRSIRNLAIELIHNTKHELCIVSQSLDRPIFDTDSFRSAIFKLARQHKSTRIKVLINDLQNSTQSQHKFLDLYRRLPSNIEVRKIDGLYSRDLQCGYIISDSAKILFRESEEDGKAILEYNPSKLLMKRCGEFLHIWEKSKESPALRQLHL